MEVQLLNRRKSKEIFKRSVYVTTVPRIVETPGTAVCCVLLFRHDKESVRYGLNRSSCSSMGGPKRLQESVSTNDITFGTSGTIRRHVGTHPRALPVPASASCCPPLFFSLPGPPLPPSPPIPTSLPTPPISSKRTRTKTSKTELKQFVVWQLLRQTWV